ncbi:MAG TPA: toll/interleukin-1 receptor domain-containing protein [Nitrospira sp.]|nr:toll/interleukin-1 receptor domain-containing protein [Nitrospira sp.]
MIVILYEDDCKDIAQKTAKDLITAFADHVAVECICADSAGAWPNDVSWDDLLIVLYNKKEFPHSGNTFISQYLQNRGDTALLLPVAVDTTSPKPPEAAAAIKALPYDATTCGRLVIRVGGMLGFRLQGRDSKIFISYRASDGSTVAKQLYDHLIALGHRPFLDEAKEIDGETAILPGSAVQKQIDDALANANLVLLLDTPAAPDSPWIKHEVDTADALLLPILPVCLKDITDLRRGPRFRSLLALQRWISIQVPALRATSMLTPDQLDRIIDEAETYLCEIFRRKCRVPFIVEKEFVSKGFAWTVLDKRLLMFESSRTLSMRIHTKVLSHCSLFDQIYTPAIKRFCRFVSATGRANYSLFIYDGELLPPPQLQDIIENQPEDVIILHHQELAALIDSNFTKLATT